MNLKIKFRLAVLGLAIGLMGALIVFITLNSQREVADLQTRLKNVDLESSGMANEFRESLRDLNNTVIGYGISHDPGTWQKCLTDSQELQAWINEQEYRLKNPSEKRILGQIETTYKDYLIAIGNFHTKIESLGSHDEAPLSDIAPAREKGLQLVDLSRQLVEAHYSSRNELLTHADQTLTELRRFIFVSVALLFVFGVALSVEVYRDLIAPLRVKLVESQALAERREKLAALGLLAAGVAHEIRTHQGRALRPKEKISSRFSRARKR
jgi:hypothetical protein